MDRRDRRRRERSRSPVAGERRRRRSRSSTPDRDSRDRQERRDERRAEHRTDRHYSTQDCGSSRHTAPQHPPPPQQPEALVPPQLYYASSSSIGRHHSSGAGSSSTRYHADGSSGGRGHESDSGTGGFQRSGHRGYQEGVGQGHGGDRGTGHGGQGRQGSSGYGGGGRGRDGDRRYGDGGRGRGGNSGCGFDGRGGGSGYRGDGRGRGDDGGYGGGGRGGGGIGSAQLPPPAEHYDHMPSQHSRGIHAPPNLPVDEAAAALELLQLEGEEEVAQAVRPRSHPFGALGVGHSGMGAVYANYFRAKLDWGEAQLYSIGFKDKPRPRRGEAGAHQQADPSASAALAPPPASAAPAKPIPKPLRRSIMQRLADGEQWPPLSWCFNGMDTLYALRPPPGRRGLPDILGIIVQTYEVEVVDGGRTKRYEVEVKQVGGEPLDLWAASTPHRSEAQAQALAVLDNAVKCALLHRPGCEALASMRSFFFPGQPGTTIGLRGPSALGLQLWRGITTAVRPALGGLMLNVDTVASVFKQDMNVMELIAQVFALDLRQPDLRQTLYHLCTRDSDRMRRLRSVLKGVKVATRLTNAETGAVVERRYVVKDVVGQCADEHVIPGEEKTVTQYNYDKYGITLRYPTAPLLCAGSKGNEKYFPPELATIVRGQQVGGRKLPREVVAELPRLAGLSPADKVSMLDGAVNSAQQGALPGSELLAAFGLHVDRRLVEVPARLLPPPRLEAGNQRILEPSPADDRWKRGADEAGFRSAAAISSFAVLCCPPEYDVGGVAGLQAWFRRLFGTCAYAGMQVPEEWYRDRAQPLPEAVFRFLGAGEDVATAIHGLMFAALRTFHSEPNIVFCVLTDRADRRYPDLKRVLDGELSLPSQCLAADKAGLPLPEEAAIGTFGGGGRGFGAGRGRGRGRGRVTNVGTYQKNLAREINAKLGGTGQSLALAAPTPAVPREYCALLSSVFANSIVIGADVTHGAPCSGQPSIAAVVGSTNGSWTQYSVAIRLQSAFSGGKVLEVIEGLSEAAEQVLVAWVDSPGGGRGKALPSRIIYYRDGVSEGQFSQVLNQEVKALRAATLALGENKLKHLVSGGAWRPRITAISAQKRHHTRFMQKAGADPRDWRNVPPGTVIDDVVTHPTDFDFFLSSAKALTAKGGTEPSTLKPPRYTVLRDESHFSPDFLQLMTYWSTYLFAKCVTPVSMVPAIYYAHLAAARGRCLLGLEDGTGSEASWGAAEAVAVEYNLPNIGAEHSKRLFYV